MVLVENNLKFMKIHSTIPRIHLWGYTRNVVLLLKIILRICSIDEHKDPIWLMRFLVPLLVVEKVVEQKLFEEWLKISLNIKHRSAYFKIKIPIISQQHASN